MLAGPLIQRLGIGLVPGAEAALPSHSLSGELPHVMAPPACFAFTLLTLALDSSLAAPRWTIGIIRLHSLEATLRKTIPSILILTTERMPFHLSSSSPKPQNAMPTLLLCTLFYHSLCARPHGLLRRHGRPAMAALAG